MDRDAEVAGAQAVVALAGHHERGDAERLGVDAEGDLRHRGVAGEDDFVDLVAVDLAGGKDLFGQLGERLVGEVAELVERVGVHHRGADAADDVGAERLLLVEHALDGDGGTGLDVEQVGDDGGGAEVVGDREAPAGRVAGLDGDQLGVGDHGGELPVRRAQRLAERAQHADRCCQLEVVHGVHDALDVGALVGEGGLFELEEALDDRRSQDHLAADADGRGLRACLQRRHLDGEVGRGLDAAGQAPAGAQLIGGEGAAVELRQGRLALGDLHLALAARAVAAAGRVDRDAVPRGRVEDGHAAGHLHVDAAGGEAQADARRCARASALLGLLGGAHRASPSPAGGSGRSSRCRTRPCRASRRSRGRP